MAEVRDFKVLRNSRKCKKSKKKIVIGVIVVLAIFLLYGMFPDAHMGDTRVLLFKSPDVAKMFTTKLQNGENEEIVAMIEIKKLDDWFFKSYATIVYEDGTMQKIQCEQEGKVLIVPFEVAKDKKGKRLAHIEVYETGRGKVFDKYFAFTIDQD